MMEVGKYQNNVNSIDNIELMVIYHWFPLSLSSLQFVCELFYDIYINIEYVCSNISMIGDG